MKQAARGGLSGSDCKLFAAWMLLCAAIVVHVTDEAGHNFLGVYNPTVLALRGRVPWLPLPVFSFRLWISGLAVGIAFLFSLSLFLARGARWSRPIPYVLSILMIANGLSHIAATILGRTVASVRFPRPMPGFYSSPTLIAASIYVLMKLRNARRRSIQTLAESQHNGACRG